MIRIADFELDQGLMVVAARVAGTQTTRMARLVIDTGAGLSSLAPDVLQQAGYRANDLRGKTRVITAVGLEYGDRVMVQRLTVLGRTFSPLQINMFELAYRGALDGVLGLDVLNRFDYEIRPRARQIITRPIAGSRTS